MGPRAKAAALLATGLLLAACADVSGPRTAEAGSQSPTAEPSSTMTVRTTFRVPAGGPFYDEGALMEIRLQDADGSTVGARRGDPGTAVRFVVPAGAYRVRAALRPCEGTCTLLDPPTAGCALAVVMPTQPDVLVDFHVGRPCDIRA